MAQPLILQLQELASDSSQDASDVLRKALLASSKLGLTEFRDWVSLELNGYATQDQLPPYRIIRSDLRAYNPFHGLVPFHIEDPELLANARTRGIYDSVTSIMQTINSQEQGVVAYSFGPKGEAALMLMQNTSVPLRPIAVVGRNQLAGIVGTVRNTVLDWALKLEAEGVLGHGLSFTDKERDIAMKHDIHIGNFQGILGNVSDGAQVHQYNTLNVSTGDFESLSRCLTQQGISKADITELDTAISADPKPSSATALGPRVSGWIGKMLTKAADGSWEVSIGAAGGLLAAALAKFYGF